MTDWLKQRLEMYEEANRRVDAFVKALNYTPQPAPIGWTHDLKSPNSLDVYPKQSGDPRI